MKTISLDLHDFSLENNNFFYLHQLKEMYPDIKISMFYIPADAQYYDRLMDLQRDVVLKELKKDIEEGWIELIPHGLTHIFGEFKNASYEDMEAILNAYEEYFKDTGLPYVKGFCAPNWLMAPEAIKCLDDHGWWYAIDRNQPKMPKAKRNYEYNWDIADPIPQLDDIKGHGHISEPSRNALPLSMRNLIKMPHDYKWVFVSERMNEKDTSRMQIRKHTKRSPSKATQKRKV